LPNESPAYLDYTLSLHDALPISRKMAVLTQEANVSFDYTVEEIVSLGRYPHQKGLFKQLTRVDRNVIEEVMDITDISQFRNTPLDRKSTRLNSSHVKISYAVFCL